MLLPTARDQIERVIEYVAQGNVAQIGDRQFVEEPFLPPHHRLGALEAGPAAPATEARCSSFRCAANGRRSSRPVIPAKPSTSWPSARPGSGTCQGPGPPISSALARSPTGMAGRRRSTCCTRRLRPSRQPARRQRRGARRRPCEVLTVVREGSEATRHFYGTREPPLHTFRCAEGRRVSRARPGGKFHPACHPVPPGRRAAAGGAGGRPVACGAGPRLS